MSKVTVIPLDSRPCNTSWLIKYAKMANLELAIYPKELCGNLLFGANIDEIFQWLDKEINTTDYLIIAADGLCSGGLVQARLGKIDLDYVLNKLVKLKKYKETNPNVKIYLFDTIMRTSITSYDEESEFYWAKMNEYSRLMGRVHFFQNPEDKRKLKELESIIPSRIIETYKKARAVKHLLNNYFIDLVSYNILDYMILLQEDSMPFGVQKIEQEILLQKIDSSKLDDRIKFYNGTDEGGVVLLGRVILEEAKIKPKVYVHLPREDAIDFILPFEDQPFNYNLDNMLNSVGFEKTTNSEDADFILSIYAEENKYNLDLNSNLEIKPNKNEEYYEYVNELNNFIDHNKKVAFVDLLFPNGGSIDLLEDIHISNLSVYSAWNTASNAMGSCLCEMAAIVANPKYQGKKMLYEHLLDDCIYQYIVRREINVKYLKKVNVYNLGEHKEEVLKDIIVGMKKYDKLIGDVNYKIELPWNRTFEIEIDVEEDV